ncbi:host-nuclease inhibitor Gam family protein [Propionivibrio sp.]|uniref:host-nuclease inhibitor Gam family protein n=1 Tax=Propionivibrio sp. TaxID=2212460 RepID=UPI003BF43F56
MATKKTRIKTAAALVFVPQNREQVADIIRELGVQQRELARITLDMTEEMSAIKEDYETMAEPRRQRIEALVSGANVYCEANRETLTQGGKTKTVVFTTGEVCWRIDPPSVRITGKDAVLALLRSLGLKQFIRTPPDEINKIALQADPEAVASLHGVSLVQNEQFVVTPFEAELAAA